MDAILNSLNFFPTWKTKVGAIGAFGLALIAAWNTMIVEFDAELIVKVPDIVNAVVLAVLGVGVANKSKNEAVK